MCTDFCVMCTIFIESLQTLSGKGINQVGPEGMPTYGKAMLPIIKQLRDLFKQYW